MLVGQDADLAEFHAQFVADAGFKKATPFSVFGYGITVEGQVHIDSKFKVAYDTLGLRELFNNGDFTKVVDGFYIGADSHLDLSGHILAHLDVDGGLVGVNVSGGITEATSKIHINDADRDGLGDDGKARLFNGDLDPECMFDASGVIKAGLKVNVHIGHTIPNPFGDDVFIGVSKDFGFDPVTLFKWDTTDADGCIKQPAHAAAAPPPPKIAGLDAGTGKLTLFMGPNANQREGVGSNTDVAEDFHVTHTGGSPDDESVAVTAFGYTQNFQHVKSIFATAGVGNDIILIDAGILSPASLAGDQDDDKLTYLGTNACSLSGGTGNDSLTSAGGADSLSGNDGNDYINGGDGGNVVKAGAGNDTVYTGSGADDIEGNEGNDVIGSGAGKDTVKGNDGDDYVESGDDADEVHGGKGKDTVLAGAGNDTVTGDEDDDELIGNADDDSITGGAGADVICGDDVTFSGDNIGSLGTAGGKDALFGDDGSDVIFGQGGDDYIEGGGSGDLAFAGDGNDRVIGGASTVVSADGKDSLIGEGGNDIIIGDNGSISAAGVVTLDSGNGDDIISGGGGADRLYGQGGAGFDERRRRQRLHGGQRRERHDERRRRRRQDDAAARPQSRRRRRRRLDVRRQRRGHHVRRRRHHRRGHAHRGSGDDTMCGGDDDSMWRRR